MTATTRKNKTTVKAAKGKSKSVAAPVKRAPRARKAARVETLVNASVANQEVMMQVGAVLESAPAAAATTPLNAAGGADRIMLPARMELASLDEACQLLQSKYPPLADKCILDAGQLSAIDSAGIQLLISFIRSTTARGCRVEWDNYSVQVYQLASELGVASELGD